MPLKDIFKHEPGYNSYFTNDMVALIW